MRKTVGLILLLVAVALAQQVEFNNGVQFGPGLLSDQQRKPFTDFYAACAAAVSAGKTLALTKTWTVATSATCGAAVAGYGGIIKPNSGQTVTLTKCPQAGVSQIFDLSLSGSGGIVLPAGCTGYAQWVGVQGGGSFDNSTALIYAGKVFSRDSLIFLPDTYHCTNTAQTSPILIDASSVTATGATFTGCQVTTTNATGSLTWTGGFFDTTAYPYVSSPGNAVMQISQNGTTLRGVHFAFRENYTAIQIGGSGATTCPDAIDIEGLWTETNGQSHATINCGSHIRINNWQLDGAVTNDGLNLDDGLAVFGLGGATQGVTVTNVTASTVYDILKITNNDFKISNVTLTGWAADQVVAPIYLQGQCSPGPCVAAQNVEVSHGTITDASGTNLQNAVLFTTGATNWQNVNISYIDAYGRITSSGVQQAWIRIISTTAAVADNVHFSHMNLVSAGSGGGEFAPLVMYGQSDANWTNFSYSNIFTNGSTSQCINFTAMQFASEADALFEDNSQANCSSSSHSSAANTFYGAVRWVNNHSTLYAGQPEISSAHVTYDPTQISSSSGTFTPVLKFGGTPTPPTGITYTAQTGDYNSICSEAGHCNVVIHINILLSNAGSGVSGSGIITGVPVTAATGNFPCGQWFVSGLASMSITAPFQAGGFVQGVTIYLQSPDTTGVSGAQQLAFSAFTNSTALQFTCAYHT